MILLLYHAVIFFLGCWILKIFKARGDWISIGSMAIVLGLLTALPFTYLLSVFFGSLSFGVYSFAIGSTLFLWKKRKEVVVEHKPAKIIDVGIAIFCLLISTYVMTKTFKQAEDGTVSVARNAIFDFGHSLSIVRSMSWGGNIPYSSPFVARTEHIYHFMFYFWIAILEYFGMPIALAVNIPGIIGFSGFLMVIYMLGKELFDSKLTGLFSVLFLVFHGGLMFVPFFQKYGLSIESIWRFPNYLFTGPFDGSAYSLFFTLNVFVNQRHLGISLAIFFLLYVLFTRQAEKFTTSHAFVYAIAAGVFLLWHLVFGIGLVCLMLLLLGLRKKWKEGFVLLSTALFIILIFAHPWISYLARGLENVLHKGVWVGGGGNRVYPLRGIEFLVLNFGLSLVFFIIGIVKKRKQFQLFLPLFVFVFIFTVTSIKTGMTDQKYLNVLQVIIALFTAAGVYEMLKKTNGIKFIPIIFIPFIMLSGVINFMVIKNDFLFPVKVTKDENIVSFIRQNTKKDAVILGYEEIFDPITLAGRKSYYGFYKQPEIFLDEYDRHRKDRVQNVFDAQDVKTLRFAVKDTGVDYILLPPKDKLDIPYTIDYGLFKKAFFVVTEDFDHVLLDARKTF
jgi:hypothetical protein